MAVQEEEPGQPDANNVEQELMAQRDQELLEQKAKAEQQHTASAAVVQISGSVPGAPESVDVLASLKQLEKGIKSDSQSDIYGALQALQKYACTVIVRNPFIIVSRFLELVGGKSGEGMDMREKRMITGLAHRFMHQAFVYNRDSGALISADTQEEWIKLLEATRTLINNKKRHENGLEFELDGMSAGIKALSLGGQDEKAIKEAATYIVRIITATGTCISTGSPSDLLTIGAELLTKAVGAAFVAMGEAWYRKVLWLSAMAEGAKTSQDGLDQIKAMLSREIEDNGDWHVIYEGIEALRIVAEDGQTPMLRQEAFGTLVQYANFNRFWVQNNWRIREKVAESCILCLDHNDALIREKAREILLDRRIREFDPRVKQTLENPQYVSAIHTALKQAWTKKKSEYEEALSRQSAEISETRAALQQLLAGQGAGNQKELEQSLAAQLEVQQTMVQNLGELEGSIGIVVAGLEQIKTQLEQQSQALGRIEEKVIEVDSKMGTVSRQLSMVMHKLDNLQKDTREKHEQEVLEQLRALKATPAVNVAQYAEQGWLYYEVEQYENALQVVKEAQAKKVCVNASDRAEMYAIEAYALSGQGKDDEAISACIKGLRYDPKNKRIPILLSELYMKIKDEAKAQECAERALDYVSENTRDGIAMLTLAHRIAIKNFDDDKVHEYYNLACQAFKEYLSMSQSKGKKGPGLIERACTGKAVDQVGEELAATIVLIIGDLRVPYIDSSLMAYYARILLDWAVEGSAQVLQRQGLSDDQIIGVIDECLAALPMVRPDIVNIPDEWMRHFGDEITRVHRNKKRMVKEALSKTALRGKMVEIFQANYRLFKVTRDAVINGVGMIASAFAGARGKAAVQDVMGMVENNAAAFGWGVKYIDYERTGEKADEAHIWTEVDVNGNTVLCITTKMVGILAQKKLEMDEARFIELISEIFKHEYLERSGKTHDEAMAEASSILIQFINELPILERGADAMMSSRFDDRFVDVQTGMVQHMSEAMGALHYTFTQCVTSLISRGYRIKSTSGVMALVIPGLPGAGGCTSKPAADPEIESLRDQISQIIMDAQGSLNKKEVEQARDGYKQVLALKTRLREKGENVSDIDEDLQNLKRDISEMDAAIRKKMLEQGISLPPSVDHVNIEPHVNTFEVAQPDEKHADPEDSRLIPQIDLLGTAIHERNRNNIYAGLKLLLTSIYQNKTVESPLNIFQTLMKIITSEAQFLDDRIELELLRITSWFLHVHSMGKQKNNPVYTGTREEFLTVINQEIDRIEKTPGSPHNGLMFELHSIEAGVISLSDLESWSLMGAVEFTSTAVIAFQQAKTVLTAAVGVFGDIVSAASSLMKYDVSGVQELCVQLWDAGKKYLRESTRKKWYQKELALEYMSMGAMDDVDKVKDLEKQIAEEETWEVIYAGLEGLQNIVEHGTSAEIQIEAMKGIAGYAGFNKFWNIPFMENNSWRIREKVAEICILNLKHPNTDVRREAGRLFMILHVQETDAHVKWTLEHPEYLVEIQNCLKNADDKGIKDEEEKMRELLREAWAENANEIHSMMQTEIAQLASTQDAEKFRALEDHLISMSNNLSQMRTDLGVQIPFLEALTSEMKKHSERLAKIETAIHGMKEEITANVSAEFSKLDQTMTDVTARLATVQSGNAEVQSAVYDVRAELQNFMDAERLRAQEQIRELHEQLPLLIAEEMRKASEQQSQEIAKALEEQGLTQEAAQKQREENEKIQHEEMLEQIKKTIQTQVASMQDSMSAIAERLEQGGDKVRNLEKQTRTSDDVKDSAAVCRELAEIRKTMNSCEVRSRGEFKKMLEAQWRKSEETIRATVTQIMSEGLRHALQDQWNTEKQYLDRKFNDQKAALARIEEMVKNRAPERDITDLRDQLTEDLEQQKKNHKTYGIFGRAIRFDRSRNRRDKSNIGRATEAVERNQPGYTGLKTRRASRCRRAAKSR